MGSKKIGTNMNMEEEWYIVDKDLNILEKFRLYFTASRFLADRKWCMQKGYFTFELEIMNKDVYEYKLEEKNNA